MRKKLNRKIMFIGISIILITISLTSGTVAAGTCFSKEKIVTSDCTSDPPITVIDSNDNIHVFTESSEFGNGSLNHIKIDDNGNFISKNIPMNEIYYYCSSVVIDSQNNIHLIAWGEIDGVEGLYHKKLDNDGNELTSLKCFNTVDKPEYLYGTSPNAAIDSNDNIHVVWCVESEKLSFTDDIYYKKLDQNGNNITDEIIISNNASNDISSMEFPSIAIDSIGNVHIVWVGIRMDIGDNIYYKKISNDGITLIDETPLIDEDTEVSDLIPRDPKILFDSDDNGHIVWNDRLTVWDIYYMKIDNNGGILVPITRLTDCYTGGNRPSFGIDSSNNIHVCWEDNRDSWDYPIEHQGNPEIYYKSFNEDNLNLYNDIRVTNDEEYSYFSSILIDSNDKCHIIWLDSRNHQRVILYSTSYDCDGLNIIGNNATKVPGFEITLVLVALILIMLLKRKNS